MVEKRGSVMGGKMGEGSWWEKGEGLRVGKWEKGEV